MPRLVDLGLDGAALDHPSQYPGKVPTWSGLLVGESLLAIRPTATPGLAGAEGLIDAPCGPLPTDGSAVPLPEVLAQLEVADLAARWPLLAIGSNASPGQVRAKLERAGVSTVLPMVRAEVDGWRTVVAAHVSRPGYVPLTAIRSEDGPPLEATVLLCDDDQLAAIDRTEPNYSRIATGPDTPVRLHTGEQPTSVGLYLGGHGHLLDAGAPVPWDEGPSAVLAVFRVAPSVAARFGEDVDRFLAECRRSADLRTWVRSELEGAGAVGAAPAVVGPNALARFAHAGQVGA